jgi:hypothetical protein
MMAKQLFGPSPVKFRAKGAHRQKKQYQRVRRVNTRAAQWETTARAPDSVASFLPPAVYSTVLAFPWNVDSCPEYSRDACVVVPGDARNPCLHPTVLSRPAGGASGLDVRIVIGAKNQNSNN